MDSQNEIVRQELGGIQVGSQHPSGVFSRIKPVIEFLTVITLVVAAGAACWSAYLTAQSTEQSIKFESDRAGNETWISFREKQILFETAHGLEFKYPSENEVANREYELVNERLLMSADTITFYREIDKNWNDPQWQDTFAYEFVQASDFFLSDKFLAAEKGQMSELCTYRVPVQEWIVSAYKSQPEAFAKLSEAKRACEQVCSQRTGCS